MMDSVREFGGDLWVAFKDDPWGTLDLVAFFAVAGIFVGIGQVLRLLPPKNR